MIGALARRDHGVPRLLLKLLQPRRELVDVAQHIFADANVELMVDMGMVNPVSASTEDVRALSWVEVASCAIAKPLTAYLCSSRLKKRGAQGAGC